ncbi:tyrosine-type recombinase/integrase [Natrialba swarupiae]|uniref:Tyrosine-type recombinase/integrase n=1 Tax=Natrialba swarupiae TaxID=2448032 RepID=A0A5D5ANG4_9EURY|nr:tyrosine-type recombinase/integrase [Natrialba swarupiae]TYT62415.1 tyrosine-type recombinase/integrase [Natrialba swarupiae]
MTTTDLEPIRPEEAVDLYLRERSTDVSQNTLDAHYYRLVHFLRWCEEEERIDNLNDLTGRKLHQFRLWRRDDGDLNNVSLRTQLQTLRVFLKFLERIDAVEPGLHDKLLIPNLSEGEDQRERLLETEDARDMLARLRRFEYASLKHVLLELMWHTGLRMGSLHSLDVEDYYPDKEALEVRHRPEDGTNLKNRKKGERFVALSPQVCEVVEDWIEHSRPDVTDEYGREPLLATSNGRLAKSSMRGITYRSTRPCEWGECPIGRDPSECEPASKGVVASKCPSAVSPHDVRRGAITHMLREEVPVDVVSDRVNASRDILDKHYNEMTEEEKMEQRRSWLEHV